eukprot:gnl/TRDRNA2_/TRDRNA2_73299_c0_seq2.p2 gnl/TRDRNA2_/TRDRNA2_73299_c0~~gnl/TRDRNA2_/TRDRNA2_73299_c0_seq2.p2  ORF type:complete len:153 (+),score=33.07 gnl/TRDRNA2_/TRDRNA2_73299_c0_seq2:183-641(+)
MWRTVVVLPLLVGTASAVLFSEASVEITGGISHFEKQINETKFTVMNFFKNSTKATITKEFWPHWKRLGKYFNTGKEDQEVQILHGDCFKQENIRLCSRQEATAGYPLIHFYSPSTSSSPLVYNGENEYNAVKKWIKVESRKFNEQLQKAEL